MCLTSLGAEAAEPVDGRRRFDDDASTGTERTLRPFVALELLY